MTHVAKLVAVEPPIEVEPEQFHWLFVGPEPVLDLGSDWDAILWLASSERRGTRWEVVRVDPSSLEARALVGLDLYPRAPGSTSHNPPDEVTRIASRLASLDVAALTKRYDPTAMDRDGVYPAPPACWARRDPDVTMARLHAHLAALSAFYREAANAGRGVLISIDATL